jgi:hypothetical protein
MTTLEKPTLRMQQHDEAIFVSADGRRARRLRRAAVIAAVVALLWVVGLGIGMLGFDNLPGVSLVKGSHAESPVAPVAQVPVVAEDTARALLSAKAVARVVGSSSVGSRAQTTAQRRQRAAKKAAARAAASQAVTPPAAALNPAQRARGWSRKGYAAPPGQLRRAEPPPPPPAQSQGRHVGQTKPPPAPVVPPGQAKKALDPPPPPPPPKKG